MSNPSSSSKLPALGFGLASALLFFLLYTFSGVIIKISQQGRWFFVVPIVIAFLFSYVHGHFTGHFWDLLGMKSKNNK